MVGTLPTHTHTHTALCDSSAIWRSGCYVDLTARSVLPRRTEAASGDLISHCFPAIKPLLTNSSRNHGPPRAPLSQSAVAQGYGRWNSASSNRELRERERGFEGNLNLFSCSVFTSLALQCTTGWSAPLTHSVLWCN